MLILKAPSRSNGRGFEHFVLVAISVGLWLTTTVPITTAQTPVLGVPMKIELNTDAAATSEIEVLEPDGTRATAAKYITGARHDQFSLDASLNAIAPAGNRFGNTPPTQESNQGYIPLPLDQNAQVLTVWSDQGYYQLAKSHLRRTRSIQLEPWAKLKIQLLTDEGPDAFAPMTLAKHNTSDQQTRGMSFVWNGNLDTDGVVTLENVPPGEAVLRTNTRLQSRGNTFWETAERQLSIQLSPGQVLSLQLGGMGRVIQGEVAFPENADTDDVSNLKGEIKHTPTGETVYFQLNPDGSFESPHIPYGPCELRIEPLRIAGGRGGEVKFAGELEFECETGATTPLNVGRIQLKAPEQDGVAIHEAPPHLQSPDISETDQKIALVAGRMKQEIYRFLFFDGEGKEVPITNELRPQIAWASYANHVAVDLGRNRIYLIAQSDDGSSVVLHTLDLSGHIVASRELDLTGSYRVAVNRKTGDIWLLLVRHLGRASVEVIDLNGQLKDEFPCDAFTLCYSDADDAIWMVGDKRVSKCDPTTGEVQASWNVPFRIWTLTSAIADPKGGILCAEFQHPDVPDSSNRLYRIDSNAEHAVCSDLGYTRINSMAFVGDEIWVTGSVVDNLFAKEPKVERVSWCFDRELDFLADRKLGVQIVAPDEDPSRIWCIQDGSLQMRGFDVDGTLRIMSSAPLEEEVGTLWTSGQ